MLGGRRREGRSLISPEAETISNLGIQKYVLPLSRDLRFSQPCMAHMIPGQAVSPPDGKTKAQRGQWVPGVTQQSRSTLQSLGPGLHPAVPPWGGPGRSCPSPFPSQAPGFWAFLHCDVLSPVSVPPAAHWGQLSHTPLSSGPISNHPSSFP